MAQNDHRVALITGANQGIGYAVAQRFAADGMRVVINGQRADAVAKAAQTLSEAGADAIGLTADVSNEAAVSRMFEEIQSRYGRLDVVFNNAGIAPRIAGRRVRVEDTPLEFWERTLAVNLTGTFLVSRAAIPLMKARRWGRIINMSSQAGRMNTGFGSAYYAASKAGILGFARMLAGEVGEYGITVNSVTAGRIKTAMAGTFANPDDVDRQYIVRTPMGRVGVPDDVSAAVAFLASDAASFITGAILDITGGFFMP
ncbi:MAG: SDR family oxidoreductase [Betaproteobacteria bacterium]|nr:SDR family oxidoreductase [Betaproteobacteria bacterium]MBI2224926.1 SDR family oxidoreductase [Betaproteobacteria bacterium]MBI2291794.1 SDR family oxidoreductase [Betaproteobacteria bacterium]